MNTHDSPVVAVGKTAVAILAWFVSILPSLQMLVAILSGLVVAGYAATQWYVLWRDKIKGQKK